MSNGGKMKEYHILSLSGGKDSTALAFFMKENMPEIFKKTELVFCDTEKEIPETYDYLNKIEIFLNKKVIKLTPEVSFDQCIATYNHLPSIAQRWCTTKLKTDVFKKYVNNLLKENNAIINMYVGIRADEAIRTKSSRHNQKEIIAKYPFVEYGLVKKDIENILEKSGIGYSDYYRWRKRSGCYFCFFQSKHDWINLYENHPKLYFEAMKYEIDAGTTDRKTRFGWNTEMALKDMIKPENMQKIKDDYNKLQEKRALKECKNKYELLLDLF